MFNLMKNFYGDEINEDKLRAKHKKDPLFRTLMDVLAAAPKDYRQLTVDQLCDLLAKAGASVYRHDAVRMLQSTHGENRGWFTIGRRGHSSRFDFYGSTKTMAQVAIGKSSSKSTPALLTHKFRLRPDLEISLELPSDLSTKEVSRISDFLKTLPFNDADLAAAA
jgi:hypothetical protein